MKYLLDTHVLLWFLFNDDSLNEETKELIEDQSNEIYYSTASLWEIEIKHNKFPKRFPYTAEEIANAAEKSGINNLPILNKDIFQFDNILKKASSKNHNDPFDIVLLSQAKSSDILLITADKKFSYYQNKNIKIIKKV